MGATSSSADKEEDPDLSWSPGMLKYYGRAELKTSDHRYQRWGEKRILVMLKKKIPFLQYCNLQVILCSSPERAFLFLKACSVNNGR